MTLTRILFKVEGIKESLQSLQNEINIIALRIFNFKVIFDAVEKTKTSLRNIKAEYNELKKVMGQQRPKILENLKLYIEFGVPEKLASIAPTQECFELDRELRELSRYISKYREDKESSEERLREIKKRIGALEVHVEKINRQKELKELIEQSYDEFERYYAPYADVLPKRHFSSRSRHQQLYDWSTKKREKERKSIIEAIRNKAEKACRELAEETDTEKNLHREMSPFGRLNSAHANKMKKLEQYCREMEERCEQINTLRDDKIAQLPKLPEIQRIRPIQLILDSLREKNNKLELQLKNVSALRIGSQFYEFAFLNQLIITNCKQALDGSGNFSSTGEQLPRSESEESEWPTAVNAASFPVNDGTVKEEKKTQTQDKPHPLQWVANECKRRVTEKIKR